MLGNFTEAISRLEQQRSAIDKAIEVLLEFDGGDIAELPSPTKALAKPAKKKRTMSEEGRKRIGEATKKRWAAVHRAAKKAAKKVA